MGANGGYDASMGMYVAPMLAQSLRGAERLWYAKGWLWAKGPGYVVRLQHMSIDFGTEHRFEVPTAPLRKVRKDDHAMLTPAELIVYDLREDCRTKEQCVPTRTVYKWEQYVDPAVTKTVGYSYVSPSGMAKASLILGAATMGRKCGFTCEQIEERHNVVTIIAQGEEWRGEATVFDDGDLG